MVPAQVFHIVDNRHGVCDTEGMKRLSHTSICSDLEPWPDFEKIERKRRQDNRSTILALLFGVFFLAVFNLIVTRFWWAGGIMLLVTIILIALLTRYRASR